jgi:glucokinase
MLAKKFGPYPIKLEHDANCFLLAEKEEGLAQKFKNIFYLTLGSGVGGAWMINGKIFIGAHGAAGEVGHIILDTSHSFNLEQLVSNKFIVNFLGAFSKEANKLAEGGDKKAQEVLGQLGKNLGIGVANIINIFDPEAIIISGGISEAKNFILSGIEEGIKKFVVSPAAKETEILFSQLGRYGGALGAAILAEGSRSSAIKYRVLK